MNDAVLIGKNLWRKPVRAVLLIVSIFVAFLLFGALASFGWYFNFVGSESSAGRLLAISRVNFTHGLPYAHLARIRSVEGVVSAAPMTWIAGYYQDPAQRIQVFPTEPQALRDVYGEEIAMPAEQWREFLGERTGLIMSRALAERFGLRLGQRVPLRSNDQVNRRTGRGAWEFTIVGVYDGFNQGAYANYEYFRETVTSDAIGWVAVRTESADANEAVARRIDALFANSPAETRTHDEIAFFRAFLAQRGDINLIITLVVGAAFASILLVVGSTAMLAARERTREIGVLKTLGFSGARIARLVLGEAMLLTFAGALPGLGLAGLALFVLAPVLRDPFPGFGMSWQVAAAGGAIALAFSLATGLAPALHALSLRIVEALGRGR